MCRLHRLLDDCHQVLAQGCQVYFIAQRETKSGQCASSIILAAIDDGLGEQIFRESIRAIADHSLSVVYLLGADAASSGGEI